MDKTYIFSVCHIPMSLLFPDILMRPAAIRCHKWAALADLGVVHPACAPLRDPIFRFDIQILRNVAASGVHAPL